MQSFDYCVPTQIYFGEGAEGRTAEAVRRFGGTRVFLVYGSPRVAKSGLIGRIEKQLADAGIACESFGGVVPNPRYEHAADGLKKAAEFKADFLLGVGGGSAIDTAKAIALGLANPDLDLWDDIWMQKVEPEKTTPVGAILTISAAGSETSNSAVLTNVALGFKKGLNIELNRPKFAIMDPVLTYTIPKYHLACGIVDILMHTLDRYFGPSEQPNEMTDEIAEGLMRTVIRSGRKAMEDQTDYNAMSELMWCGSLSHNDITGLGRARDFSVHGLGHSLSAQFDMIHGCSLALLWPNWAEYVVDIDPARFARLARKVWDVQEEDDKKAAEAGIEAFRSFFRELGMPTCFSESEPGLQTEEQLKVLVGKATLNGAKKIGAFKALTDDDVLAIYRLANR